MAAASALLSAGLITAHAADEAQEQPTADQLLIDAQKICPVSGAALDSMGGPIKAESGGRTVFLCCRGCLGKSISKENWEQVTANLIAAQGTCPVMDRELPENPASVVVNKRTVFVCCKPCIKKIEADPEKYLAAVDELLRKNLQSEESAQP
jgi:hypothetical protein